MALNGSAGEIAAVSAAVSVAAQYVPRALAVIFRGQLAARRATLEELRAGQENLDKAYHRLEKENTRLHGEIDELRAELQSAERENDECRRRCEIMENVLRRMDRLPPEGK